MAKVRSPSPNRAKASSVARKAALLSRFSDAYSQARLDAQCLLRRCIDKAETVQRIIYVATVVGDAAAAARRGPGAQRGDSCEQGGLGRLVDPGVAGGGRHGHLLAGLLPAFLSSLADIGDA